MSPTTMQGNELSYPERQFLELHVLGKWSLRRIARAMYRNHSVLSREIHRNAEGGRYQAKEAQDRCEKMRKRTMTGRKLESDPILTAFVTDHLSLGWSPEKIAGRAKSTLAPPRLKGTTVSHETIYQWLYSGDGRYGGLVEHLWSRRRRRYVRRGRKPQHASIVGKISVAERPDDDSPGHLESDSMIWWSAKGLLSAQVCRKTKICRLKWCENRSGEETARALRRALETLPQRFVRDITFDNGSENARHRAIAEEYDVDTYFCDPHSPWQKPQIENLNRTIRHYLPRKTKVSLLTERDWKTIEDRLNNLPRKSLAYLTPNEALIQYLAGVVR